MSTPQTYITHICRPEDWRLAQEQGSYTVASLETQGFIHCSRPDQVLRVANFLYKDQPGLLLLWIDPDRLASPLRWEHSDDNLSDDFPHIYGPLNLEAVVAVRDFPAGEDGLYQVVPDLDG